MEDPYFIANARKPEPEQALEALEHIVNAHTDTKWVPCGSVTLTFLPLQNEYLAIQAMTRGIKAP